MTKLIQMKRDNFTVLEFNDLLIFGLENEGSNGMSGFLDCTSPK